VAPARTAATTTTAVVPASARAPASAGLSAVSTDASKGGQDRASPSG
jgi:hypothetical protein